jgi:membrane dipeptidase
LTEVVDAHSDLLMELVHAERELGEANPFRSRWLPPLRRGGMSLQVCAIYVEHGASATDELREVLRQAAAFHAAVEANRDAVVAVRTATDLDELGDGRVGLMLAIEGLSSFGPDAWLIDVLTQLGVRMASLTWNESNAFAGGVDDQATGLTPLGGRIVDRMVEQGIVVDLAHASPVTFADVLERLGDVPLIVSHASCRALYDHPRNMTDGQLAALAEQGGLLGLMPHPIVLGARATLDTFLDHVDHAVEVMGVQQVGLGGDFGRQLARALGEDFEVAPGIFADSALPDLEGPQDYPALTSALRLRGYADDAVAALMGGNLLALLRRGLAGGQVAGGAPTMCERTQSA